MGCGFRDGDCRTAEQLGLSVRTLNNGKGQHLMSTAQRSVLQSGLGPTELLSSQAWVTGLQDKLQNCKAARPGGQDFRSLRRQHSLDMDQGSVYSGQQDKQDIRQSGIPELEFQIKHRAAGQLNGCRIRGLHRAILTE